MPWPVAEIRIRVTVNHLHVEECIARAIMEGRTITTKRNIQNAIRDFMEQSLISDMYGEAPEEVFTAAGLLLRSIWPEWLPQ